MIDRLLQTLTDFFLHFLFDSLGFFIPERYHRPLAIAFSIITIMAFLAVIGVVIFTLTR